MKLGLKLWSVNTDAYLREARRLYGEGVFGYLELYVVPGTLEALPLWKALHDDLNLPFVIHAPHSAHGVNFSDAARRESNAHAFDEVRCFADGLSADKVIVHGGARPFPSGVSPVAAVEELSAQLSALKEPRILLENKPFLPIGGVTVRLVGSTPDEIRRVLAEVGCGFCLDIGHAVCSANAHGADYRVWLADFLALHPAMFHLSDLQAESQVDQHLHFGTGSLPLKGIVAHLPPDATVSIETKRDSAENLDDFVRDAGILSTFQTYL